MAANSTRAIGVDIGGTGIKGGIVDLERGELLSDRVKVSTPKGAKPQDVLDAVTVVPDDVPAARAVRRATRVSPTKRISAGGRASRSASSRAAAGSGLRRTEGRWPSTSTNGW